MDHRKAASSGEQIASALIPSDLLEGDDEQDTSLLSRMAQEATKYISSFSWCDAIHESYFGGGVGGVFAVFFFRIRTSRPEVDPWIWIIVGDVPPAYLPLSACDSPRQAFRSYIRGMTRWVEMVRSGSSPTWNIPPITVPATPQWAERLNEKLYALTITVGPYFEDEDPAPILQ